LNYRPLKLVDPLYLYRYFPECTEGFQCDGYAQLHNRFLHGKGRITQPVNILSSICALFCVVVYKSKQAGPLKSGKALLALNPSKMNVVLRIHV
jgi:hypothetical protein